MSYRLRLSHPLAKEVRRVADDQLAKAIRCAQQPGDDTTTSIHDVRKCCKKVRGLLRLVRPAIGKTYGLENSALRDAAASVSQDRELQVLPVTFDLLMQAFAPAIDQAAMMPIRQRLAEPLQHSEHRQQGSHDRLRQVAEQLAAVRRRIADWPCVEQSEDVLNGVLLTYRSARDALAVVNEHRSAETLHELRKQTKYHWYHCRLLRDLWPRPMKARAGELSRLGDLLGDDHDLAILEATLAGDPQRWGDPPQVNLLLALAAHRSEQIQQNALQLSQRVLAEKPRPLRRRLGQYWRAAAG